MIAAPRAIFMLTAILALLLAPQAWALDAFPGAQGYGAATQGGRNGRMIYVTNLNDAGTGSFRACAEATGARNCIFRVGGIIRLKTPIAITSTRGQLSILGQTAPGSGILLSIGPAVPLGPTSIMYTKGASNVLVRHIRARLQYPAGVPNSRSFTIENSSNIYLDHYSGSWATDENITTHKTATKLTIAYSIFAEGLDTHSKCALLGSDPTGPQSLSFWRNLCMHNNDRNPDNNHYAGSCIEITNNVFYNARSEWSEVYSQYPGGTPVSYAANYYKGGPNTNRSTYAIQWQPQNSVATPKIYAYKNLTWGPVGTVISQFSPATMAAVVGGPPCALKAAVIDNAATAYDEVRARAGAFPRDAVDRRLIAELNVRGVAGTGAIKNTAGVLPVMNGATPYVDGDFDGMADSAEAAFGARPGVYDPWVDSDSDGWPNFDEFMEWLSKERIASRYPS